MTKQVMRNNFTAKLGGHASCEKNFTIRTEATGRSDDTLIFSVEGGKTCVWRCVEIDDAGDIHVVQVLYEELTSDSLHPTGIPGIPRLPWSLIGVFQAVGQAGWETKKKIQKKDILGKVQNCLGILITLPGMILQECD